MSTTADRRSQMENLYFLRNAPTWRWEDSMPVGDEDDDAAHLAQHMSFQRSQEFADIFRDKDPSGQLYSAWTAWRLHLDDHRRRLRERNIP